MIPSPPASLEPVLAGRLGELDAEEFDQALRLAEQLDSIARWPTAFRRQLPPDLVEVAQSYVPMPAQARAAADQLRGQLDAARARQAELAAKAALLEDSLRSLRSQRDGLGLEVRASSRERDEAQSAAAKFSRRTAETAQECSSLQADLASWHQRVAFMEQTNAWRLRAWLLRLRGRGRAQR